MQLEDSQTFCTGEFWPIEALVRVLINIEYLAPKKLMDRRRKEENVSHYYRVGVGVRQFELIPPHQNEQPGLIAIFALLNFRYPVLTFQRNFLSGD